MHVYKRCVCIEVRLPKGKGGLIGRGTGGKGDGSGHEKNILQVQYRLL